MEIPPERFPKTPPIDPATHPNDWRSDLLLGSFPHSATTASFATSTIEAPRFPRRRKMVIVKNEIVEDGNDAIANQDIACNKAEKDNQNKVG